MHNRDGIYILDEAEHRVARLLYASSRPSNPKEWERQNVAA